jgi:exopolysaccharide biosynthesis polyprenyl glycosylphosphotransferase
VNRGALLAPEVAEPTHDATAFWPLEPSRPQRKPVPFSRRWVIAVVASDVAIFALAAAFSILLVHATHLPHMKPVPAIVSAAAIVFAQMLLFQRLGLYQRSLALSIRDEFYYATVAITIGALPLLVFFTILPQLSSSRLIILASLSMSVVGIGATRAVIHEVRSVAAKRSRRRIALVGRTDQLRIAAESLNMGDSAELMQIAVDDLDRGLDAVTSGEHGGLAEVTWLAQAAHWGCDTLLLTQVLPPRLLPSLLELAARYHMKVGFAPPRFRVHAYGMALEVVGEQALIIPVPLRACTPPARLLKRIFDVAFASVVLVLSAPVMALCALAIKLDSPGPVLYKQTRVGRNGRLFEIEKLRSMPVDIEAESGPVWASSRKDPRATRVGKVLRRLSLDEVPQFLNVLRGDMSIVGPRPERPEFVDGLGKRLPRYEERHLVRPGITGWAQVNLSRSIRPSQAGHKLQADLFYVEQWSIFLDFYILVKTAIEFLFHKTA